MESALLRSLKSWFPLEEKWRVKFPNALKLIILIDEVKNVTSSTAWLMDRVTSIFIYNNTFQARNNERYTVTCYKKISVF